MLQNSKTYLSSASLFFFHKVHIFLIVLNKDYLVLSIYLSLFSLVTFFHFRVSSVVFFLLSEVHPLEFHLVSFLIVNSILHVSNTEMNK